MTIMRLKSNAEIDHSKTKEFLDMLLTRVFSPIEFQWRAASIVMDTYGPDEGYGLEAFFYDDRGAWSPGDFLNDNDEVDDAIYGWIEETYTRPGEWFECLIEILSDGTELQARLEFEFRDIDRWATPEDDRLLGDILRPTELPTPLGSGLRRKKG